MEGLKEKKVLKTLLLKLDVDFVKTIKVKAAQEGKTMKDLVISALNKTYGI